MNFFWWLRRLLYFWVRTKVVPADPKAELELKPGVPVCYVLANHSLADLLVLDQVCHEAGLPLPRHRPSALKHQGAASYIYLLKAGILQADRSEARTPPSPLAKLVSAAKDNPGMDVQLVPVSVLWGRNPGKSERSIFKLLFFDDERAGMLQKLFIVLAQGRSNFLHFGKPISLQSFAAEGADVENTSKKLVRVLRVHFRRQRTAMLGPSLPTRAHVVASLMQTRALRQAVQDESRKAKIPLHKAELQARRYLAEIAADTSFPVIRFFDVFLTWVLNKLYRGIVLKRASRLRSVPHNAEIIYLPSHRSHMDYLLLAYSLFYEGLVPPHTAAGVNLNFWPAGPLLRRAGGFFIRRSLGGNRLYTAVFNEYVHYLITKGHSLKFYIEGGRSRTGKLLQPKTGMLAMVVHSYLRSSERPIVFVPIYLGYDKVMEVRTYHTELRGKNKSKESMGQLLRARRALKADLGKAYIGFGEPLSLDSYLDAQVPDWRQEAMGHEGKPPWLHAMVAKLANEVQTRINGSAVVSPVAIFALVMLSSPHKAMAEEELIYLMDKLLAAMRASPYSSDITLPEGSGADLLHYAMDVCKAEYLKHPGGNVVHLDSRESALLTYYRNNILHLVAMPALVASFFQHNDILEESFLLEACSQLYPLLKSEFFLRWPESESNKLVKGVIDALVDQALLVRDAQDRISRPSFDALEFTALKVLARMLGQTFEGYAIATTLLAKHAGKGAVEREAFEKQCRLMAQRISILNGTSELELFDSGLFRTYIEVLKDSQLLEEAENSQGLSVSADVLPISNNVQRLLSGDIRQSLQRLLAE